MDGALNVVQKAFSGALVLATSVGLGESRGRAMAHRKWGAATRVPPRSTAHARRPPAVRSHVPRPRAVAVGYGSYSLFFVRPAVRKAQVEAAAATATMAVDSTPAAAGGAAPAAAAAPLR